MSSFNRRTLLLSLSALGACGFRPAYGPTGPARTLKGTIEVDAPDTVNGFNLVRRLEERLGQPSGAQFALSYSLTISEDDLAITQTQEITRYNVLGRLDFSLRDLGNGAVVTSGKLDGFTSYSATGSTVGAATAQDDAYARLMILLADQLTSRLIATSANWLS